VRTPPFFGTHYEYDGPAGFIQDTETMTRNALTGLYWPTEQELNLAMFASGGTAINRTLPTKSASNLALTLIELVREGIPSMIGSALMRGGVNPRTLAEEYLNYEFGWAPLIRDVQSLMTAVVQSAKILEEYHRQSGEHIRRRFDFGTDTKTDTFELGSILNSTLVYAGLTEGTKVVSARPQVTRKVTQKTWFSGAYRYYLPYGDDLLSQIKLWESNANHLLGVRITPELLWNATPWTWLLDWFANIGDVISNISHIGRDGLILHYAYIMQETTVEAEFSFPGSRPYGGGPALGETVYVTRKNRRKASPYGFGLTTEEFSPKQWAILGALGLTQAPGRLYQYD
jgi:hypothetical protein